MVDQIISSDRFKMVVAVHLFLIKENKILLLRRFQTGYEDGNYSVPAGHLDGQETATQAMIREAKEETEIIIHPQDLHFAHVMHRLSNREGVDFFFSCTQWENDPRIGEIDKCDELRWVNVKELPSNTIPYIRSAILSHLHSSPFSELGW